MTKEENKHTITLKTEWVDMDKLVLTNHKGDTYTTKSEELMDFILSSESENERLKADNKPDHLKRSLELLDEFIRDNPNGLNEIIAKHIEKVGHDAYFLEDVERLKAERELEIINFATWYSSESEGTVKSAYKRYKKLSPPKQ